MIANAAHCSDRAVYVTRDRLSAALQAMRDQADSAGLMLPTNPPAKIARGHTLLLAAQRTMVSHLVEVRAVLQALKTLDSTVVDITLQDVIASGAVIIQEETP